MSVISDKKIGLEEFRRTLLEDYRLAQESRQASLLGRREVLTGRKGITPVSYGKGFQRR